MNIYSDISVLKGVGPKKAELLRKAGIDTVYDLLSYYPRSYEDWSKVYSIREAPLDTFVCVKAFVGSVPRVNYVRKGMTTYRLDITDGVSVMDVVFFNNKYAAQALKNGEQYIFRGKISAFGRNLRSMSNPDFFAADTSASHIKPIYSQSGQLTSKYYEKLIKTVYDSIDEFPECLPTEILDEYNLLPLKEAYKYIHFPENYDQINKAKRRFVFEELFLLQLGLLRLKIKSQVSISNLIEDYSNEFINRLKFELTGAQKRVISECAADMLSGKPMNRLVQGDVGSGKTVVSAAAIYSCVKAGYQAALIVPTEVLAAQHYKSFLSFFDGFDINVALLTGSTPAAEKRAIKQRLKSGEIDFIIGTHALIQSDVEFNNLALTVTDEQHRFGVAQRGKLNAKGNSPHVLVMSATPIPRTLSFIVYGDLDLSVLDELPAGRQKFDTFLIDGKIRERAYGYVKKHLCEGRQGYIVCPLVNNENEDEYNELIDSMNLYKNLSEGYFKGFKLGLLHGKMKSDEKKLVMEKFASGEIDLLISTTVIEVGVDVPNAVIMVIENADRFGLSQLHQLRGRVGRGEHKSTCILISDNENPDTIERLKIIESTADGFKIADADLKLRGPGDIFGSRQHGLPNLRVANLITDSEIVKEAHLAADKLLKNNPTLEGEAYVSLKKSVNRVFSKNITLS